MITSGFIYLSAYLLGLLLSVFPLSTGLPTQFTEALNYIAGYVGILDPLVPIDTLGTTVGLILAYELLIFAFRGFRWVISHVPLIGGRG